MKKVLLLLTFLLFISVSNTFSQNLDLKSEINLELVRAELDKRGLENVSIEEIENRLVDKGIDLDNLTPSQAPLVEAALKEIYTDLKAEQSEQPKSEIINETDKEKEKPRSVNNLVEEKENAQVSSDTTITEDKIIEGVVYGQAIFANIDGENNTNNSTIKPSPDYTLGEGDELIISIIGNDSQFSNSFEINTKGYIQPDRMEAIFLKGLTLEQAERMLHAKFKQYYKFNKNDFKLSLNFSRNIDINVTGMARNYGTFTLPATNTIFNALVASKGPNDQGSVRNITLRRKGKAPIQFDIYKYLNNPSVSDNIYLENGDYLHIPALGKVVEIEGEVRRPYKYELKKGEGLNKLIEWAGGLNGKALKNNIKILRYENGKEKIIVIDLEQLERTRRDFPLLNGDRIEVLKIPGSFQNYVAIGGEVDLPGKFEYRNGMKVSELIKKGMLKKSAKLDEAFLYRKTDKYDQEPIKINIKTILQSPSSSQNLTLQPLDSINVFSQEAFKAKDRDVIVTGAVKNPNTFPYLENARISNFISLSGGLNDRAMGTAYIYRRQNPNSPQKIEYIRVNISDAIKNPNGPSNVKILPSDEINVFSYEDVTSASGLVTVEGAVLKPNTYEYSNSMTLRDVLFLSGLKLSADKSKIDIYRIDIKNGQATKTSERTVEVDDNLNVIGEPSGNLLLQPFDVINVRSTPDFELQQTVHIKGEVKYPGPYSLLEPNEKLYDVIRRSGGFKESAFEEGITLFRKENNIGYLVVDLNDLMNNENSPSNYILKHGDEIVVPKIVNVVSIQGYTNAAELYETTKFVETNDSLAVEQINYSTINVPFHKGKNVKFYIDEYAGGIQRSNGARLGLIKVKQPGGKVEKVKNYGFYKKYPVVKQGATIIVDRKQKRSEIDNNKNRVDWGEIITNTVSQATAILTLVVLIQQIQ